MKQPIDYKELQKRIELNFQRLTDDTYYQIQEVFSPSDYEWYGDKEGRALLAFVSHYKISGRKIPCMEEMIKKLPEQVNEKNYLGPVMSEMIIEQQLSGHSWLLRGLCEYYEQFGDPYCLTVIKGITENLYFPTKGKYSSYPIDRESKNSGGVSGTKAGVCDQWILSSDIGCAFMSIDGLSHVYKITGNPDVKDLLDEMIKVYLGIDKISLKVQTHCTLTAARGMMRMYFKTKDKFYLDGAECIYDLYVHGGGMTYTYQNLNWWGRADTWTEPCAIIDSLMLALELYKVNGREEYRTIAARIYHNGFATLQRENGGAGTDTVVCEGSPWKYLAARMYEAFFCCTMRLAEGLWYIDQNKELLYAQRDGRLVRQKTGVYMDGDILYGEAEGGLEAYAREVVEVDGHKLSPIVKYYCIPRDAIEKGRQNIVFD